MSLLPILALALAGGSSLSPTTLRCEYLVNPLGLEETRPRLSWVDVSGERGARQRAYRILVANNPAELRSEKNLLWDSGKVDSDQSTQVEYAGAPLHSMQRAYWRVQIWDDNAKTSESQGSTFWEMGLLNKSDWSAQWIGMKAQPSETVSLKSASWIWFHEENAKGEMPKGSVFLRKQVHLDGVPSTGRISISADDHFKLTVNGATAGSGDGWQSVHTLDISKFLKAGTNDIVIEGINDTGKAGVAAVAELRTTDGNTRTVVTDISWTSSKLNGDRWVPALVVGPVGMEPWGVPAAPITNGPAPYLRKQFEVSSPVVSARISASALGLYKLYIDGKIVSHDELRPGWTDYKKRVQYETYDVTPWLKPGAHAIGMVLGNGWYCGRVGWTPGHNYGDQPWGLVQLEMKHADGSVDHVVTDDSWQVGEGPIQYDDLLNGETYDARKEDATWATAGFNGHWATPVVQPLTDIAINAQQSPSVQQITELHAKTIKENPKGSFIYDLGQNMVGWARLKVHGPSGTAVRLRFAEMLNPDGSIYVTNLRSALATDNYTLSGKGNEVYEPSFTFHGFRYVEVTGYPGTPGHDAITGIVEGSNNAEAGTFACSNPMVNQLSHNIHWGQRGNYVDVPTDCPQRDERLGWMGDAQIFVRTATFNNDIAAFMTKWTRDVEDAQSPAGGYSDVSPRLTDNSDGAPAWGDAGVIVPWTIYQAYGDKRILEARYDSMAKWIQYIDEVNPDHIWIKRSNNNFGDWLNVQDDTPREVIATAYFAHSTDLMARTAAVLGKTEDAAKYRALFEEIKAAFIQKFVSTDMKIKGDSQTDYVLALWFGLLPAQQDAAAVKKLADHIMIDRKGHLSTGFVGVGYLCPTLTEFGRTDIAYKLLDNDTYPSWGYSIRQGATTIWERWDGWRADKGFQDPGMNSFNHYSLGSVGEWMYNYILGINYDPKDPGYHHIIMEPIPGGGMTWAKGSLETMHGLVKSEWHWGADHTFTWDVTVPANTKATLVIPTTDEASVTESNVPIANAAGVTVRRSRMIEPTVEVGGGTYHFRSTLGH